MPTQVNLRRPGPLVGVGLLLAALLLFPNTGKSLDDLRRSWGRAFRDRERIWTGWKTERGGEDEVLPPEVRFILGKLREEKAESYFLSPRWASGEINVQRLIDGGFPLRPLDKARYFVGTTTEPVPEGCRTLADAEGVLLAACP